MNAKIVIQLSPEQDVVAITDGIFGLRLTTAAAREMVGKINAVLPAVGEMAAAPIEAEPGVPGIPGSVLPTMNSAKA